MTESFQKGLTITIAPPLARAQANGGRVDGSDSDSTRNSKAECAGGVDIAGVELASVLSSRRLIVSIGFVSPVHARRTQTTSGQHPAPLPLAKHNAIGQAVVRIGEPASSESNANKLAFQKSSVTPGFVTNECL